MVMGNRAGDRDGPRMWYFYNFANKSRAFGCTFHTTIFCTVDWLLIWRGSEH